MRRSSLWLLAGLLTGCASGHDHQAVKPPVLFPVDGLYELKNSATDTTGYVFAETDEKPGRQTLRWLLLDNFKSPVSETVIVKRAVVGSVPSGLPTSSAEFAAFSRKQVDKGDRVTYVKSYADTFVTSYDPPGPTTARTIATIPAPLGRRAPDPPGQLPPADWAEAPKAQVGGRIGAPQQIDGGSVGIVPGEPPRPPVPPPPPPPPMAAGYLDPRGMLDLGVVGMAIAGPQLESNAEYWFIPQVLFQGGLENTTLAPFSNKAIQLTAPPIEEWAVVVVNSSYYPGFVPNDW